jgi:hypothetical protein
MSVRVDILLLPRRRMVVERCGVERIEASTVIAMACYE